MDNLNIHGYILSLSLSLPLSPPHSVNLWDSAFTEVKECLLTMDIHTRTRTSTQARQLCWSDQRGSTAVSTEIWFQHIFEFFLAREILSPLGLVSQAWCSGGKECVVPADAKSLIICLRTSSNTSLQVGAGVSLRMPPQIYGTSEASQHTSVHLAMAAIQTSRGPPSLWSLSQRAWTSLITRVLPYYKRKVGPGALRLGSIGSRNKAKTNKLINDVID